MHFLRRRDVVDSLRIGYNWPELRDRLTILVMVGTRTETHFLRSQVGIASESDCSLGQLKIISEISDSVAGLKVENWGSVTCGEGTIREDKEQKKWQPGKDEVCLSCLWKKKQNCQQEKYSVSQKSIPNIFSRNTRKHCRILIIFGTCVTNNVNNQ